MNYASIFERGIFQIAEKWDSRSSAGRTARRMRLPSSLVCPDLRPVVRRRGDWLRGRALRLSRGSLRPCRAGCGGGHCRGAEWIPTAAFCAVAGVGGYLGMRRARRAFDALVNCCAAGLLGIWANVFAGGLLYGRQAIDAIYTAPQGMVDALGSAYSLMGYTASEVQAVQSEFILSYGEMVPLCLSSWRWPSAFWSTPSVPS